MNGIEHPTNRKNKKIREVVRLIKQAKKELEVKKVEKEAEKVTPKEEVKLG